GTDVRGRGAGLAVRGGVVRRPMRRRAVVAVSIGAIALATSCRSDLAGPTLRGNVATTEGLLSCKPLGYDSVTQTLGPAGGVVKVSKHNLVGPAGALSTVVSITAGAPSDTANRVGF